MRLKIGAQVWELGIILVGENRGAVEYWKTEKSGMGVSTLREGTNFKSLTITTENNTETSYTIHYQFA